MNNKWYLRKSDDTIYGPVALDELVRWAADGRIDPSDFVSVDQSNWIPVGQQPELEMDWVIRLPEGEEYGPIHQLLLAELILDEDIPPTITVHNAREDVTSTACSVALRALTQQPSAEAELREQLDQMQADHARVIQDATALQQRLEARVEELEQSEANLRSQVEALSEARAKLDEERQATANEDGELKSTLDVKESELRLLRSEVESWETRSQEEQQSKADLQNQLEKQRAELKEVQSQLTASQSALEKVQQENKSAVESARAELTSQIEEMREWARELENELVTARSNSESIQTSKVRPEDLLAKEQEWERQRAQLENRIQQLQQKLTLQAATAKQPVGAIAESDHQVDSSPMARAALLRLRSQARAGSVNQAPESALRRAALAGEKQRKPPKPKKRKRFPVPGRPLS